VPFSSVCVYCGSSDEVAQKYKNAAEAIGTQLARRGLCLVYGGGHVGLMGILADAALKIGGRVIGIIPEHIQALELPHEGVTELHLVPDMHTRKRMMVEKSDAFVILPGGLGTLDEAFEVLTWKKLKLHKKPIILLNQDGYWDDMIALFDCIVGQGFSCAEDRAMLEVVTSVEELFARLDALHEPTNGTLPGRM